MTEGNVRAPEAAPADGPESIAAGGLAVSRLAGFAATSTVRRQRRVWSGRVASWDQHGSANLQKVTAAVLQVADIRPGAQAVDLGCGNGQLSLPLAERGARVLAVDVSPAMVEALQAEAGRRGLAGLEAVALPVESMALPAGSADLIVSSYALHHLRDRDKPWLVAAAFSWLRPGGMFVLADMMFGRGASPRDREIIASKVAVLARKGPGGWWRIAKNAARYQLRMHERPVSTDAWSAMMAASGFTDIVARPIAAEAGLITARRPATSAGAQAATQPAAGHATGARPAS
ncbi:MAG: class I SAM-dependent methyltransferase [Streptosporangiaceae bacterium]